MEKILLVDDDEDVLDTLIFLLEDAGYQTHSAKNGSSMFKEVEHEAPDLIMLDLGLGDENGLELAIKLRKSSMIPIIMLTGKGGEASHVVGLELGADDYITKPYRSAELLARVKSVLRRSQISQIPSEEKNKKIACFEGCKCDLVARRVFSGSGEEIELTSGEFSLLAAFLQNPNQVLSRQQLLDLTGRENTFDRSVNVQVLRLRKKIQKEGVSTDIIKAIRSIGYIFTGRVSWN